MSEQDATNGPDSGPDQPAGTGMSASTGSTGSAADTPAPGGSGRPDDSAGSGGGSTDTGGSSGSGGSGGDDSTTTGGEHPFGRPGPRLNRHSPFYLGFVGALGLLTAWALWQSIAGARGVLVLVVIAFYLAIALNPLVEILVGWRMRRGLAVLCVFVLVIVGFALAAGSLVPVVTKQIDALIVAVPDWLTQLRTNERILEFDQKYEVLDKLQTYITSGGLAERLFGGILGFGQAVLGALFNTLAVLILTLYFLATLPQITGAIYQLVPRTRRDRVQKLSDEVIQRIGRYVGGQVLVAAINGMATFLFLSLAISGVEEYAVALAIVVGICGLIPLIGGALGAILAIAVVLVSTFDLMSGVYCLIFYIIYQQLENYLIMPRVMQRSVNVPGAVVVVAALLGGSLLGIVGALLAIPTAAAILLLIREIVIPRQEAT